jgi:serine/threonine protein kinase
MFISVRFPVSRFDIYKPDSAMYNEAIHNPNLSSDIPNELKLLIRMLLSVDPSKRPSCNEILSKLRSFRRDDHAAIFQDIPSEWRQPSPTPSPPVSSPSPPPTSSMESVAENPTATTLESSSPELIAGDNFGDEPSFKKHRLGSVSTEDSSTHSSTSSSNHVLRKRQRLLSGRENTMMDDDPVTSIEEEPVSPPRLLLGSPDFLVESNNWLTERYSMQAIKTGTAILKVKINDESFIYKYIYIYLLVTDLIDCFMYILLFALFHKAQYTLSCHLFCYT